MFFTSVASQKLRELTLNDLLNKNPYLYRSDGIQRPGHLLDGLLIARISSSDETIFGNEFFEPLALWVAGERGTTTEIHNERSKDDATPQP